MSKSRQKKDGFSLHFTRFYGRKSRQVKSSQVKSSLNRGVSEHLWAELSMPSPDGEAWSSAMRKSIASHQPPGRQSVRNIGSYKNNMSNMSQRRGCRCDSKVSAELGTELSKGIPGEQCMEFREAQINIIPSALWATGSRDSKAWSSAKHESISSHQPSS